MSKMRLSIYIAVIFVSITLVHGGRTRIEPVRFIRTDRKIESRIPRSQQRSARSYADITIDVAVYTEPTVAIDYHTQSNSLGIGFGKNAHISPDFSNGLEYPDPLLLTGSAAKRAVRYFYSRELFFTDIPHVRAILRNQEMRRENGLAEHRLGSLRNNSPFYRFKRSKKWQNYL